MSRTASFRWRTADRPLSELGWVTARQIEPLVWLERVDGRDLVCHETAVQLAPWGPQAGLQVELVAVALLDGVLYTHRACQRGGRRIKGMVCGLGGGVWSRLTLQNWKQPWSVTGTLALLKA